MQTASEPQSTKKISLTAKIVVGMISGAIIGVIFSVIDSQFIDLYVVDGVLDMIGTMFVNALQMLVVPLVVFSLICGVTGIGDIRLLGRVGGLSLTIYLITTAIAIASAILVPIAIGPGSRFELAGTSPAEDVMTNTPQVWDVIAAIIPSNPIAALADGNMLQIIFYVILLSIAAVMLGDRSRPFVEASEYMNELIMKIVEIVMSFAPYGVFCLIAKTFSEQGIDLFLPVLGYVITLTTSLLLHLFVTLMLLLKLTTGLNPIIFLKKMRPVQIFAFSTASSSATIPVTLRTVTQRIGVDNSVASFTVPFGATINMDGTAIMQGVATVFLSNVYGIELGIVGYLTVILMSVLASVGTAGVPGVGLIMLTMVLAQVGLPVEGIAIILGVDRLMDMIRTAVNITGDAVVSTIVAIQEGKFDIETFNDADAGVMTDEALEIDLEAEARLSKAAYPPSKE